ncbi:MAG: hypothetical protein OHK93_001343 [Ramalina farinacea]|uniref:Uncharacterized protein n=1 Tax=Ramalina farinacea TaxID=258253 RepID=A0AA43TW50_9LECA|nr:hypothetical protein [Ramalina farinacea]
MPTPTRPTGGSRQRVPSSLSKVSTPPVTSSPKQTKTSKPSLIVQLKLQPKLLRRFTSSSPSTEPEVPKVQKLTISKNQPVEKLKVEKPDDDLLSAGTSGRRDSSDDRSKGDEGNVKVGQKRELGAGVTNDETTKPKAAQRKRPKVGENGRIDGRTAAAKAMGYNPAAHKLGPKANQGAINEKLRALDRTKKPCRRWQKTGFNIKSFTGRGWEAPSWRTPQGRSFGEAAESGESSSNDLGKENSSSNLGSEQSPAHDNGYMASSPLPIAPSPA